MSIRTQPAYLACDACGAEKEFKLEPFRWWSITRPVALHPPRAEERRSFCCRPCFMQWLGTCDWVSFNVFQPLAGRAA